MLHECNQDSPPRRVAEIAKLLRGPNKRCFPQSAPVLPARPLRAFPCGGPPRSNDGHTPRAQPCRRILTQIPMAEQCCPDLPKEDSCNRTADSAVPCPRSAIDGKTRLGRTTI